MLQYSFLCSISKEKLYYLVFGGGIENIERGKSISHMLMCKLCV